MFRLIRYSRTYAYKTVKSLGFQKNKYAMNSFQWKYSPTQSHRRQEGKASYSSFVRHHKALVQVVVKLGGLLIGIFIHYALPWQPFESIFSLLCGASSTQLPDEPYLTGVVLYGTVKNIKIHCFSETPSRFCIWQSERP